MTKSNINVFLVDDHQVLLDGLELLLRDAPGIKIVGSAYHGQELLEKLHATKKWSKTTDIILMDINMPVMDGYEATRQVKLNFPNVKVIVLSMQDQVADVNEAVASGADGFLSKNKTKKEIIDAIKRVYEQGEFVLLTNLETPLAKPSFPQSSKTIFITDREKQIICLICQAYEIETIARMLSLSTLTVSIHRKNIMSKLKATSDADIVQEALKHQWCKDAQPSKYL